MDQMNRRPVDWAAIGDQLAGRCFICELVAGTPGFEHEVVYQDAESIAFLNRYPTLLGYVLVAPRAHLERVTADFNRDQYLGLQGVVYRVAEAVRDVVRTERIYILSLGSQKGNSHVHWHVAALPPGVPYRDQQFRALDRDDVLDLPAEQTKALADRLRARLLQPRAAKVPVPDQDALEIYDEIAGEFAEHALSGVYNSLYDRPAVLELLGDVRSERVLDAGCGPGLYLEELVARGAIAVGIDGSREMVRLAHRRLEERALVRQHHLTRPLPFVDGEFDAAISALVIHYLEDRISFLRELRRVVKPGGRVVISTQHPVDDWLRHGGNYFEVERVADIWRTASGGKEVRMPFWRTPLTVFLDEIRQAGFVLDRFLEPQASEEIRERAPASYQKLSSRPVFLAVRLIA
jgi:SAM-dependent methyltransferase